MSGLRAAEWRVLTSTNATPQTYVTALNNYSARRCDAACTVLANTVYTADRRDIDFHSEVNVAKHEFFCSNVSLDVSEVL